MLCYVVLHIHALKHVHIAPLRTQVRVLPPARWARWASWDWGRLVVEWSPTSPRCRDVPGVWNPSDDKGVP